MSKTLQVTRQEIKYGINYIDANLLANDLRKFLIDDPNNHESGYQIRSLYFDSYGNTDFYEKMDGTEIRKKIRLRIYSPDATMAKLEIKRKFGNDQEKSSVIIERYDAIELIKCNYDVLKKYDSPTAKMILNIMKVNHLKPVVLIEYKRLAFMHPLNNIRITVDSDIRASETDFDLFNQKLELVPIEPIPTILVEVKFDGFLFNWLNEILARYPLDRMSFSKYSNSRHLFENYLA